MHSNFFARFWRKSILAARTFLFWSWRLRKLGTKTIIGKVKIVNPRNISIGSSAFIDDFVVLNASGSQQSEIKLGDKTTIREGTVVEAHKGTIILGDNVFLGHQCCVYGQGGVSIGSNTMIAVGTSIIPSSHVFSRVDMPYREQGEASLGVAIGKNCWLGARCTVLDGVKLGDNVVVAAGSVVTKSFGPNLLLAGSPAKAIKQFSLKTGNWEKI